MERLLADLPVFMPGGEVLLEGLDQGIKDLGGDVIASQRGFQRGAIIAGACVEYIVVELAALDGGQRVLVSQIAIGVIVKAGLPRFAVLMGDQGVDAALADLQGAAVFGGGILEL